MQSRRFQFIVDQNIWFVNGFAYIPQRYDEFAAEHDDAEQSVNEYGH